jgi:hypothetical protein
VAGEPIKTVTTTEKECIVRYLTRTATITATATSCDKWQLNCRPQLITKTETEVYPTTVFCPYPVRVTKTIIDHDVVTVNSICTKVKTETQYQRIPVPCDRHPCPLTPETKTVTKYVPREYPYPCLLVTNEPAVPTEQAICTFTETKLQLSEREPLECHRKPCGPETVTETVVQTVTRACVRTKEVLVPTTVPIVKHVPVPVHCTVTEVDTITETLRCTAKPCHPRTVTKYLTQTKVKPCVIKETAIVTSVVSVPKPYPVHCTSTTTETSLRRVPVPVTCTKYPCPVTTTNTFTDYQTRTIVKPCIQKQTETATLTKYKKIAVEVPVVVKEDHYITKTKGVPVTQTVPMMCTVTETETKYRKVHVTCSQKPCKPSTITEYIPIVKTKNCVRTATETDTVTKTKNHVHKVTETDLVTKTQYQHHIHTTTKHTVCTVTETETRTAIRNRHRTRTEVLTFTKTQPCVVTETVYPCNDIWCPPSPPPRPHPEPLRPQRPPRPKPPFLPCDDDQCSRIPRVLMATTRQCDANGVVLRFAGDGLLRDQLNRIGYIADNYQFQFDLPVQAGGFGEREFGEYTDPNTGDVFLTWRGSTNFFKCRSGSFDNLYSVSVGGQCRVTRIMIFHCVTP